MAKGRGRTGATRSGNKAVDQSRGGVGGNASGFLGPVTTGRGPNHKATGQPIRNGRPVRQTTGLASLSRTGGGGTLQTVRTGNPPASGRQGVGGNTHLRDASGKGVSQTVTPGSAGNFPRTSLKSSGGRPSQQSERAVGNVVKAKGRKQSNSGRLGPGAAGIEYQDGKGNLNRP